ncbi:NACHT domain-containing protein [Komarekiella sp. 'clone 1']|uniref:NACHT domain-containing protein n=1 Tax=Komarekiella delphini-convector SJRDD-AB1 TaxID=2593771 RepID=A0AA40T180_9NOST|nr:HEAT repeat domain-containing protein [Komarekiella delphini-convector]MBD6618730.1 NACHT domain-containing protein [Komarekiella delphini-convector SJRDD-AB1]
MLDWLFLWGVTQAAGLIFKPILEDLAKDAAKDWAKDLLKGIPGKIFQKLKKEDIEIAAGKALKEFLQLMQQQLKVRCKLAETEIKEYTKDIKKFISDKSVTEILGRAFDINCESLDAKTLEDSWNRLQLKPLPSKFNWQSITEQYLTQVQELLLDSKELHHILELQKLSDIEINTKEIAGIVPDFNLIKYQEGIREWYGNLKLDSLDTSGYAYNELKLWQIFTAQNVRETHQVLPQVHELPKEHLRRLLESEQLEAVELEELERHKRVYFEQPIRSVLDVVNKKQDYKYIVILGDPGSGKSTLLQFLALNWAESPLNNVISLPIPLLIELRTYMRRREDKECNNFLEFFHKCSGAIHHLNQLELDKQLKVGNALVMFDGLDEVFDPGKREDVITDIHRFTNDYPDIQVIVTSRIIGYKPQRLLNAEFRHFILQDLDSEQIQDFINRWHELTFTDAVDKVRKRERLKRGIAASKSIAELAGNPLLLTMMAILNRNQELPRDRATLYDQASRVLLHQWDVERALMEDKRLDPKTIDYKDKQAMLRQVAYLMQTGDKGLAGNLINENDLVKVLTDYLKTIEFDKPREVARVMINQLRTRNFMLCFLGADYYAFVHRTFLEYFCAWEFVWQFKETQTLTLEELKNEVFGKHWQDESWHEVLLLIAGMIEPRFVGEILDYLMMQDGEEEKFVNLFLAAKCLVEVRNRLAIASTAIQLLDKLKDLTKYDLWYYYDLYHDEEETKLAQEIRTQAVTAIATTWQESLDTKTWLKERATQDDSASVRRAAVQELAQNFKDDLDTKTWLKQRATHDNSWYVRRVAVQELAQNFKDDPDTKSILKERSTQDDNTSVRCTAVEELTQNFKDDPDTKSILKERATKDDNEDVRGVAVQELAKNFKDDPDTKSILKERATKDDSPSVQLLAVQELAQNFKDDPDTKTWLKERVTKDDNWYVRRAVVQELAQNFKDDSDIKSILKERATKDDNEDVRGVAVQELAQNFKDDPNTETWLKERTNKDDSPSVQLLAVQELAQNFKDDPDTKTWLKERATKDDNWYVRRIAVQELAQNFKDDPDTKSILKERATQDDDNDVRRTAVQKLAQNFKDDPETKSILKERATQDDNEDVRGLAVQKLAQNFKYDPDTKSILKALATQDDNNYVRGAAVEELAQNFKDDPDTKSILKERATKDDNYVRGTAVEELAQNFKDDPDTKSILKERATQDDNWYVRRVAVEELAKHFKYYADLFDIYYQCAVDDSFKDSHDPPYNPNPRRIALEIIIKQFPQHPQTLPMLRDRAKNDPDEQVREYAQKKLAQLEK